MDQKIGEMLDHELWSIGKIAKQANKTAEDALGLARIALEAAENAQNDASEGVSKANDASWEIEQLQDRVATLERRIAALIMPKPTMPGM